ncbi:MAG TPA: M1 family metallopeptidase [Pseudoneobacillus sp.]|nr:M1 family metallopeptidase [Pseudoneobacillus sp.]
MRNHLFTFINEKHDGITKHHLEKALDSMNGSNNRVIKKDYATLHTSKVKKISMSMLAVLCIISLTVLSLFMFNFQEKQVKHNIQTENEVQVVAQTKKVDSLRKNNKTSFIIQDGSHANYQLFLKMLNETNFLVEANIEVENRSKSNWMDLQFYFIPNMFDAAKIKEIKVNGEKMKYDLYEDSLRITLNKALQIGKKMNVNVSYTLSPPKDELRLFRSDKSIALAEWYPMLCIYLNGWQKDPYYPGMESFFTGYSDFAVQYELLEGYTLTSSAEEDAPVNSQKGSIEAKNIKEFYISLTKDSVIKTKKVNQTEIRVIGSKQNEKNMNTILNTASDAFEFFDSRIGKYPYKQLDIEYGNGYNIEYPGIVTVMDEGEIESQIHPTIHEVAHQWFYGLVSNDTYNDGWLDEGLTEFSTDLFLLVHEKKTLDESFSWVNWLYNERDPYPSNQPLDDFKENGGTAAYLYAQPVIKLWEVMGKVDPSGNEALKFLSDYFHTYSYQIVNTEEFIRFMRLHYEVDDKYFEEWLNFTPEYIYWNL